MIRGLLLIIAVISLFSCRQKDIEQPEEQLELILLGLPQEFDTANLWKLGSQKYFRYNGSDSLIVKSCTYLNDVGEPILPVECNYYKKVITTVRKYQFDYFIQYVKQLENGELIKKRPKDVYCDIFGGWIAIYTGKDRLKKHFVFDCYGLPDSIEQLCNSLHLNGPDTGKSVRQIDIDVNTDSIVQNSYKILEKEFIKLRPKRIIKFTSPK